MESLWPLLYLRIFGNKLYPQNMEAAPTLSSVQQPGPLLAAQHVGLNSLPAFFMSYSLNFLSGLRW